MFAYEMSNLVRSIRNETCRWQLRRLTNPSGDFPGGRAAPSPPDLLLFEYMQIKTINNENWKTRDEIYPPDAAIEREIEPEITKTALDKTRVNYLKSEYKKSNPGAGGFMENA